MVTQIENQGAREPMTRRRNLRNFALLYGTGIAILFCVTGILKLLMLGL